MNDVIAKRGAVGVRRSAILLSLLWLLQIAISAGVQIFIAAHYGTSASLDAYLAGVTIPTTLFMVFSASFGVATVTYFHEVRAGAGTDTACQRVVFFALTAAVMGAALAILLFLVSGAVRAIFPGLDEVGIQQSISVLRLTALSLPFLAASTVLQGLLQANHRFYGFSLAGIVQIALLPILILVGFRATPLALAWGFDLGALASCLMLFVAAYKAGFLPKALASRGDVSRVLALTLPLVISGIITHLLWISERHYASMLGEGAISALSYGQRIINLLSGGLTYGITTVLLPSISAHLEDAQLREAGLLNRRVLLTLLIPTLACCAILLLLSRKIITLAFERGAFTHASTELTSASLTLYVGLFVYNVFGAVIMKNAFAAKEGWLVTGTSALLLLSFLLLAPSMISRYGFAGLPLTTSIAFVLSLLLTSFVMLKKHPHLYAKLSNR